jgi:hypothetical protein
VLTAAVFTVAQQTAAIAIYGNTACTAPAQANLNVNSGACNPVSPAGGSVSPLQISSTAGSRRTTAQSRTQLVCVRQPYRMPPLLADWRRAQLRGELQPSRHRR